ncbi:hypothetical protein RRG08_065686 [Elysia crispata]|uniref:Uncharacterized protein n=1 Tax=Elysia crispata TaxID=231223 RepID=A0AAE0YI61_9GAST|nr:hypothetical protein RRG08_065686 [Elysia crispata]
MTHSKLPKDGRVKIVSVVFAREIIGLQSVPTKDTLQPLQQEESIFPYPEREPTASVIHDYAEERREDAARAIQRVSGYGYDHLILNVEWAK